MTENGVLLKVDGLEVIYKTDEATIYAVNDISFEVKKAKC